MLHESGPAGKLNPLLIGSPTPYRSVPRN